LRGTEGADFIARQVINRDNAAFVVEFVAHARVAGPEVRCSKAGGKRAAGFTPAEVSFYARRGILSTPGSVEAFVLMPQGGTL
jgi:hypothetical protein